MDHRTYYPSHGSNATFQGAILAPNGKIFFIPADSSNIGIYDPMMVQMFHIRSWHWLCLEDGREEYWHQTVK